MDKIYIDYENIDLLDMPIDDSNYAECRLIGYVDLNDAFQEESKVELGNVKLDKKGKHRFWIYVGAKERGLLLIFISFLRSLIVNLTKSYFIQYRRYVYSEMLTLSM